MWESAAGLVLGVLPSVKCKIPLNQEKFSDLIGPYWGTYGIVYRVLQPLLEGGVLALEPRLHLRSTESREPKSWRKRKGSPNVRCVQIEWGNMGLPQSPEKVLQMVSP